MIFFDEKRKLERFFSYNGKNVLLLSLLLMFFSY